MIKKLNHGSVHRHKISDLIKDDLMIEPMQQSTYDYVFRGNEKVTVHVGNKSYDLMLNLKPQDRDPMTIGDLKSLLLGHINNQTIMSGPFLILEAYLPINSTHMTSYLKTTGSSSITVSENIDTFTLTLVNEDNQYSFKIEGVKMTNTFGEMEKLVKDRI